MTKKEANCYCSTEQKFIPQSNSYCLSLALCLQWYNALLTPQMHSTVYIMAYTTDGPPS